MGTDLLREIGGRMTRIRGERSQAEFAPVVGLHKNTLGTYERADREIGAGALARLVAEGWNANWLLTGEGPERLADAQSGTQVTPGSHAARLDIETLRSAIEAVESGLDVIDYECSADGKARLVSAVYDRMASQALSPAQVVAFVLTSIKGAVNAGQ